MLIDEKTRKLLDVDRVLAELHTTTPYGLKYKNSMKPYTPKDKKILENELERIEKIKELIQAQKPVFLEIKSTMKQIKDIRRSIERTVQGGVLTTVELFELKNLNSAMNLISNSQKKLQWKIPEKYIIKELKWVDKLLDPDKSGLMTFYIYDSYSKELAETRKQKQKLEQQFEANRKNLIKEIEQQANVSIRITGEITVSRSNAEQIEKLKKNEKLQVSSETYMNTTFKIKPDEAMLKLTEQIETLKNQELLEEGKVLEKLSLELAAKSNEIISNMEALGEFDLLIAKAYLAIAQNAVKPIIRPISQEGILYTIINGRNPVVEAELRKKSKEYMPITIKLNQNAAVITGANMGGKTVSLKMAGLLAAMVHYGLLVPADYMEMPLFDFIFLSAGDQQSVDQGLSTFGAEMQGIKNILCKEQSSGLILIDELARGTNPQEGYAISYAIIDYLIKKQHLTIITTHFDKLVREGVKHLQVNGLRNIDTDLINSPELISQHMDYTLIEIEGNAEVPRDALKISKMMGIPKEIIEKAEEIMGR